MSKNTDFNLNIARSTCIILQQYPLDKLKNMYKY